MKKNSTQTKPKRKVASALSGATSRLASQFDRLAATLASLPAVASATPTTQLVVNPLSTDSMKPTTFELTKIAATLATAETNRDNSLRDLAFTAMKLWKTCGEAKEAEKEKQILISTVGKMRDKDEVFGVASKTTRGKPVYGSITTDMWIRRLMRYPGNRADLFGTLLFTYVPEKMMLKELSSREKHLQKFLRRGGKGGASNFIERLACFLTASDPVAERELLVKAVKTADSKLAEDWLAAKGVRDSNSNYLVHDKTFHPVRDLFEALKSINEGRDHFFPSARVPALLCRWLIHSHQKQVSKGRSDAGKRTKVKSKRGFQKS